MSQDLNALFADAAGWRRLLHQNPALAFEESFASDLVASKLTEWGIPHIRGIGKTGIVATIEGKKNTSGAVIGLRGDMDALPIDELPNKGWPSKIPGRMHACGHDGHTATLLAAAKYLNDTRDFDGAVRLIFQPAEEAGLGAQAMIGDGLFSGALTCDEVYAYHNDPQTPLGTAGTAAGPFLASADDFTIKLTGRGGHIAFPEKNIDPILPAARIYAETAAFAKELLTDPNPDNKTVLAIASLNAGILGNTNIVPQDVHLAGTVRSYSPAIRRQAEKRLRETWTRIAAEHGVSVDIDYQLTAAATINHPDTTSFAVGVLQDILGADKVDGARPAIMGAEDFGAMTQKIPGTFVWLGQGTPDPQSPNNQGLHTPGYDFNDAVIPLGVRFFAGVVQKRMPLMP